MIKHINKYSIAVIIRLFLVMIMMVMMQAVWAPQARAVSGDVTGEGIVDFKDLAVLTHWWLIWPCEIVDNCEGADMTGPDNGPDGIVDFYDFVLLASHWLDQDA